MNAEEILEQAKPTSKNLKIRNKTKDMQQARQAGTSFRQQHKSPKRISRRRISGK